MKNGNFAELIFLIKIGPQTQFGDKSPLSHQNIIFIFIILTNSILMMKRRITFKIVVTVIAILTLFSAFAQQQSVSIGTTTVKDNAVLYLVSQNQNQGLIVPVVSNRTNVISPEAGMVIYDQSNNRLYYRNNSAWVRKTALCNR